MRSSVLAVAVSDGEEYGRVCTGCGKWRPADRFYFTTRDGLLARCRDCMSASAKEKNAAKMREEKDTHNERQNGRRRKVSSRRIPKPPLMNGDGRLCSSCQIRKPPNQFTTDRRNADGLSMRCHACARTQHEVWKQANIDHAREEAREGAKRRARLKPIDQIKSRLKARFGMTIEDVLHMLAAQGNACAICRSPIVFSVPEKIGARTIKRHSACVDHCHTTGKVRGLLCSNCNTGIGLLADDLERVLAAAKYLEERS